MKTQNLTLSWPWWNPKYDPKDDKPLYQVEKSSDPIIYKPGQKLTETEVQRIRNSHKWTITAIRSK